MPRAMFEESGSRTSFFLAKKAIAIKREAESFKIGNKLRIIEQKCLRLQTWIVVLTTLCIALSIVAQEITFFGYFSNTFGADWFDPNLVQTIKPSDLEIVSDTKLVLGIKFSISIFTCIQLALMIKQDVLISKMQNEQIRVDMSYGTYSFEKKDTYSNLASTFRTILKYALELVICAIHPIPFLKRKYVMTIVGKLAIYNIESLV
jgi:hypothetical protein